MYARLHLSFTQRQVARPEHLTSKLCVKYRKYAQIKSNSQDYILRRLGARYRGKGIAPSAAAEAPTSPNAQIFNNHESDLHTFLSWLVANGVKGIGHEGSKVALFQSENGERGLVCEEPISRGELVLEVPLRLALTDHPGDEESNELLYSGAPWSVRLACKLLRHVAIGERSPWATYIKVLPRHVPAPLECFSWEDISALRYAPAEEALHSADWLRADAFMAVSEEARGGLGEEEFRWALSLVHSRTFANAAPSGGVGVRMLVPLVDLLNHGGDEVAGGVGLSGGGSSRLLATDCVRWDLLSPARSSTGGWSMVVSATQDMQPGREILMSYGERTNDDFFLHYGFVPRANPHDEAVLWPDLESALEWHYERLGDKEMPREAAEKLYLDALEEGRQEQIAGLQLMERPRRGGGHDGCSGDGTVVVGTQVESQTQTRSQPPPQQQQQDQQEQSMAMPPEISRQMSQIRVVAGGQVSAAVMRAFSALSGGDLVAAERAVAFRCAELLGTMTAPPSVGRETASEPEPLHEPRIANTNGVADNNNNNNNARAASPLMEGHGVGEATGTAPGSTSACRSSVGGLLTELAMLLADTDPRVVTAAAVQAQVQWEPEDDEARYWAEQLQGYSKALLPRFVDLLPEGAAVMAAIPSGSATTRSRVSGSSGGNGGGIKSQYGLPPVAGAKTAITVATAGERNGGMGKLIGALLLEAGAKVAEHGALRLTGPQRLSAAFRCYKQMLMWDVVVGSGVEPQDLAEFAQGGRSGRKQIVVA